MKIISSNLSERPVNFLGCLTIRLVRVFSGMKDAKMFSPAIDFYSGDEKPASLHEADAFISRCVISLWAAISKVFGRASFSQIYPAIIRTVAINVVNFLFRPPSSHVEPCQPVGHIITPVYGDFNAPLSAPGWAKPSSLFPDTPIAVLRQTNEYAGTRIIVQTLLEPVLRQGALRTFVASFHLETIQGLTGGVN